MARDPNLTKTTPVDPDARPSPSQLWHRAEGDTDRYLELMREHGYIVAKTCGHVGRCACQNLPCGWPGL